MRPVLGRMVKQINEFTSKMTVDELRQFASDYFIPEGLHPEVPHPDATIEDFPVGKVGLYT